MDVNVIGFWFVYGFASLALAKRVRGPLEAIGMMALGPAAFVVVSASAISTRRSTVPLWAYVALGVLLVAIIQLDYWSEP